MSTILCRQSSSDSSHVIEATTMKLKLLSPKSYNQTPFFAIQSPSHYKLIDDCFNKETNSYIHNQISLKLSQKSLELCTESLGSETGCDMRENDTIISIPAASLSATKIRRDRMESKKMLSRSFPPPLMTMSGLKVVQVRAHRAGGRLVIEAIETDLGNSRLRAERSHGRLRLTCCKNEEGDLHMGSHESDMKETFQKLRRCNEEEINGDKGICNWEPCCWVAIS